MRTSYAYGRARYQQKKRKKRLLRYVFFGAFIALILGIWFFISRSPVFQIKNFYIQGASMGEEEKKEILQELEVRIASTFRGSLLGSGNYFSWKENLSHSSLMFSKIETEKDFFSKSVKITLTPRERFAIWCVFLGEQMCFWVDGEGLLFETAPIPNGQLVPTIYERSPEGDVAIAVGARIFDSATFAYINSIISALREQEIPTRDTSVLRQDQELSVLTESGTLLIFSLAFDPRESAIAALKKINQDEGLAKFSQIDFTARNRALVKLR